MTRLPKTTPLILLALVGSVSVAAAESRAGATQSRAGAAQSSVPQLNLRVTCSALDNSDIKIDTERCIKSENEARATLANEWSKHSAADRDLCTQTARLGGVESYVQLLTCLELQKDVVAARAQGPRIDTDAPLMRRSVTRESMG
jgi:hypothetical protein